MGQKNMSHGQACVTGQDFFDPTGEIQNLRRSTVFVTEGLCSAFNNLKPKCSLHYVCHLMYGTRKISCNKNSI